MRGNDDLQNHQPTIRHVRAIALIVAAAFFMENLDATVIATALPQMARSFNTQAVDINVGVSAYMLALGIFIPASGWLTTRFGARTMFLLAVVIFTLSSLFCGLSQNLPQFVIARILQGVGGAMMVPVGRLVVLRATPKEKYMDAIALLTWPGLVAPVLGPPVGGLIAQYSHWSLIFYLNIPIGIIIILFSWKLFPVINAEIPKRFDLAGFALTGLGLAATLFAVEEISKPENMSFVVLVVFAVGLSALGWSGFHLAHSDKPLMPLTAFKYPTFRVSVLGGTLFRMGANAITFIFPLMAQLSFGYEPFYAGLLLIPVFVGNLMIKPFTTPIMRAFGLRMTLLVNCVLNALFLALCAFFNEITPLWLMISILFLSGVFRSIHFTALNVIAFADVPNGELNGANTLFSTLFQLAIGLGIAFGAISLRLSEWWAQTPLQGHDLPFQLAFLMTGFLSFIPLWGIFRLKADVGDLVAGRAKR